MKITLKIKNGEIWYGGNVAFGGFTARSKKEIYYENLNKSHFGNQITTLLVSSMGRYIYAEKGFSVLQFFNAMSIKSDGEIIVSDEQKTLKEGYKVAQKCFFPTDGKHPDFFGFNKPQYCTWIALGTEQTQEKILSFAKSIIDAGLPAGELIIDDGWQIDYGEWDFLLKNFSDPDAMLRTLSDYGFQLVVWLCPFVSKRAKAFDYLEENRLLVRDKYGKTAFRNWWNGCDALLDLSNPTAMQWFLNETRRLMDKYPVISGVKQDAGDIKFYRDDDITHGNVTASEQSYIWASSAVNFKLNELRACVNQGGKGIMQRQMDKSHLWNRFLGLKSLVPCALLQGLLGYPYNCPDMIGGGQIKSFRKRKRTLDKELIVRWLENSILLPAIQFSYPIWTLQEVSQYIKPLLALREEFLPYIDELIDNAAKNGDPIVRFSEYDYPHENLGQKKTQFFLGEKYLVAPVMRKNQIKKRVFLPKGQWKDYYSEKIYCGGKTITVDAPLGIVPIFVKE